MAKQVVTAYKGFEEDLTCRGFQYKIGKEYEQGGEILPCSNGFHACENPLDVLNYYDSINNRFCEVEQSGTIVKNEDKVASSKIKIKTEIGFIGLFKVGIEYLKELTNPEKVVKETKDASAESGDSAQIGSSGYYAKIGSSGDSAKIGSSGDYAQIGSSGDSAKIGSSGDSAQINSTGEDSVICCAGHGSCVKAKQGSWITLAEWEYNEEKNRGVPKCVKTEFVDGVRIKADTWYKLQDGEFKEVE